MATFKIFLTGEEGGVQRDEELISVLDKMILYLRIVHSVDFYNHSEYPNEDEMPNRCGILHARGIPPPAKVTSQEVEEYMKTFEKKMGGFLVVRGDLTPEEAAKFGLKVEVDEVEKFIAANTQELGKVTNHSDKAIFDIEVYICFCLAGQVALSLVREEVQRAGFCEEAHNDQAHGEGGRSEEGGQLLQQLLEGEASFQFHDF